MPVAIISLITSLILEKIVNHSSADLVLFHLLYAQHLPVILQSITIFEEKLSIIHQLIWCLFTCHMLTTYMSHSNQHLVMSQLHPSTLPPHATFQSTFLCQSLFFRNFLEQFGDLNDNFVAAILLKPGSFLFFLFVVKACEVITVWKFLFIS